MPGCWTKNAGAIARFCAKSARVSTSPTFAIHSVASRCRASSSSTIASTAAAGIYEGVNAGIVDLALLRVIELYDRTLTRDKLDRVLRETRACNGWLIFYTHDVAEPPSWIGASPRLLHETIDAVQTENIRCLPIREALAAIGFRRTTEAAANSAPARRAGRDEDAQYFWRFDQIAPPQPPRLLRQTIGPFQTEPLQPARRARSRAGQKIDRRADAQARCRIGSPARQACARSSPAPGSRRTTARCPSAG